MSLSSAWAANTNIIDDVLSFEPDAHHSAAFLKVMRWLKQSVQLQRCVDQSYVETRIQTDLGACVLVMKAWISKEYCIISDVKRIKRD